MTVAELKARLSHAKDDAELMITFDHSALETIQDVEIDETDCFSLDIGSISICDQQCHAEIWCGDTVVKG